MPNEQVILARILNGPIGIAVDAAGNAYVTSVFSAAVFKITPGGVITEIIDATGDGAGNGLSGPNDIAVDVGGNVYVSAGASNNAFKITPAGVITEIIDATGDGAGNGVDQPFGIGVDAAGNVYVANLGFLVADAVFKITPAGVITVIIDATGDGAGNGLNGPIRIAVDVAGNVFVTGINTDNAFKIAPPGPGDLDTTFGSGGLVTTDIGSGSDIAIAVAIQTDGKIVAAGLARIGSDDDFALARYNTDGSLDTTFGTGGLVTTDFASDDDGAFAVAIQADGKIVAAGSAFTGASGDFALARYNTDGSLDTTFGTGGLVTTDFASDDDRAFAVAIQADGKIVAAGLARIGSDNDFALARYNTDGSLDTTFGTGGLVTTDFASDVEEAFAVAIQADGKIVATGRASNDFGLARYNTDGSLDSTFGTGGLVTTDFGLNSDQAFAVTIQGDGKIVAAGMTVVTIGFIRDFGLARYNSDGSLDTTFGSAGLVTTDFGGGFAQARGVVIQDDGKIIAAGIAAITSGSTRDFALARYNPDGSLDTSFGTTGLVTTDFASDSDQALAVAIQADGKIVAAGSTVTGPFAEFALARYLAGPTGPICIDGDGDGISDPVDPQPSVFSDDFSDTGLGGMTTGTLTSRGDQILCITDEPSPDGVRVLSTGGSTDATLSVCGGAVTLTLGAGDEIIVTCGSVTIEVISGPVDITFVADGGGTATVSLPAGNTLVFDPATFTITAPATNSDTVIIVMDGEDVPLDPGESVVGNNPPVCDADGPHTEACQGLVTKVGLDGSGSSDPDGNPLTFSWTTDCPNGSFDDDTSATPILTLDSPPPCPVDCTVTLTVDDGKMGVSSCIASVTVSCNPRCTLGDIPAVSDWSLTIAALLLFAGITLLHRFRSTVSTAT